MPRQTDGACPTFRKDSNTFARLEQHDSAAFTMAERMLYESDAVRDRRHPWTAQPAARSIDNAACRTLELVLAINRPHHNQTVAIACPIRAHNSTLGQSRGGARDWGAEQDTARHVHGAGECQQGACRLRRD